MFEIARIGELDSAIEEIRSRWGQSSIRTLKMQLNTFSPAVVSTGLAGVDAALSIGGLPRGITTFSGIGSSGIVTLALAIMGNVQSCGLMTAYFDISHTFDPDYAQHCGVDLARLLIVRPFSVDEAWRIVYDLVVSNTTRLIVFDLALAVDQPIDAPFQSSAALQRLANRANMHACALVCLSPCYSRQVQAVLDVCSAASVQATRTKWHHEGGAVSGCTLELAVIRNKFAPVGKSITQRIDLGIENGTLQ